MPFVLDNSVVTGWYIEDQATDYSISWNYSVAGGGSNGGSGYANGGTWIVVHSRHTLNVDQGYTTELTIRKVLL